MSGSGYSGRFAIISDVVVADLWRLRLPPLLDGFQLGALAGRALQTAKSDVSMGCGEDAMGENLLASSAGGGLQGTVPMGPFGEWPGANTAVQDHGRSRTKGAQPEDARSAGEARRKQGDEDVNGIEQILLRCLREHVSSHDAPLKREAGKLRAC